MTSSAKRKSRVLPQHCLLCRFVPCHHSLAIIEIVAVVLAIPCCRPTRGKVLWRLLHAPFCLSAPTLSFACGYSIIRVRVWRTSVSSPACAVVPTFLVAVARVCHCCFSVISPCSPTTFVSLPDAPARAARRRSCARPDASSCRRTVTRSP